MIEDQGLTRIFPADCDFGNSGMGMCGWQPEIANTWYDPYWKLTDDFYMRVSVTLVTRVNCDNMINGNYGNGKRVTPTFSPACFFVTYVAFRYHVMFVTG